MKVDINLLKKLRYATFAPMKECKEALVEANGDLAKAQKILREKGSDKAGKKADRLINEGIVKVIQEGDKVLAVKLLCETDFVAKNKSFTTLVDQILDKLKNIDYPVRSKSDLKDDIINELDTLVSESVGAIGENMQLGDVVISSDAAYVYNHPGNKVASIIYYQGGGKDVAKEIALQVAAMNPKYMDLNSVPSDIVEELKAKATEELKDSSKPDNIIEQIIQGKINKALAQDVLFEQEYIRDGAKKIKEIVPEGFELQSFVRLSID